MTQRLRIATWNICWFAHLFDDDDRLIEDDAPAALQGVTRARQAGAIGTVLSRVDADLFAIIEAPDTGRRQRTTRALAHVADRFALRQHAALTGFQSDTEQEIALLFDPARLSATHAPIGEVLDPAYAAQARLGETVPRFDSVYPLDIDGDGDVDLHQFSKPPLEAEIRIEGDQRPLRLIAVHAKSKAPHGADTPEDIARISLRNRRKQLAQCAWLRARVEDHLRQDEDLIILGDFNDGPGQDKYERVFGRSGVEVVMGDPGRPETLLRNPYTRRQMTPYGARPSTARFYNWDTGDYLNALLDFVMLSPGLAAGTAPEWRIWHPFDDAECYADTVFRQALLEASDHFPVTVDLSVPGQ